MDMAMLPQMPAVYDESLRPVPRCGNIEQLLRDDEEWFNIPPVVKAAFRSMQSVITSLEARLEAAVSANENSHRAMKTAMAGEVARRTDGVVAKTDKSLDELSDRIADMDNAVQRKIEKLDINIRTVNDRVQRRATFKATIEKESATLRDFVTAKVDAQQKALPAALEKWASDAPPSLAATFDAMFRAKQGKIAEQTRAVVDEYVTSSAPALVKVCNDSMHRWAEEKFPAVFVGQLRTTAAEKAVLAAVDTYCATAPPTLTRMVRDATRRFAEDDFAPMFAEELRAASTELALHNVIEGWVNTAPDSLERQTTRTITHWDKSMKPTRDRFVVDAIDAYLSNDTPPLLAKHCQNLIAQFDYHKMNSLEYKTALEDQIKRGVAEWVAQGADEFTKQCTRVVAQWDETRAASPEYQAAQANAVKRTVEEWLAPAGAGGEPPRAFVVQVTRVVSAWNEHRVNSDEYLARQGERTRQVVAGWMASHAEDFTKPCMDVMVQWGNTALPLLLEKHLAPATPGGRRIADHIESWVVARPAALSAAVQEVYRSEAEGTMHAWVVARIDAASKLPPPKEHVVNILEEWAAGAPHHIVRLVSNEWSRHVAAVEKQRTAAQREAAEMTKQIIEEYVTASPPAFVASCTAVTERWAGACLGAAMMGELKSAGVERAVVEVVDTWFASSTTAAAVTRVVEAEVGRWAEEALPLILPSELKRPGMAGAVATVVEAWLAESVATGGSAFKRAVAPVVQAWADDAFGTLWARQLRAASNVTTLANMFEEFLTGGGDLLKPPQSPGGGGSPRRGPGGGGAPPCHSALKRAVQPLLYAWADETFSSLWGEQLRTEGTTLHLESVVERLLLNAGSSASAALQAAASAAAGGDPLTRRGSIVGGLAAATSSASVAFRRAAAPVIQLWIEEHFPTLWMTYLQDDATTRHIEATVDGVLLGEAPQPPQPRPPPTPAGAASTPGGITSPFETQLSPAQQSTAPLYSTLRRAVEPLLNHWAGEQLPALFAGHLQSPVSLQHLHDVLGRYLTAAGDDPASSPGAAVSRAVQPQIEGWAARDFAGLWAAQLVPSAAAEPPRASALSAAAGGPWTGRAATDGAVTCRVAVTDVIHAWARDAFAPLWEEQLRKDTTDTHLAAAVDTYLRSACANGDGVIVPGSPTTGHSPVSPATRAAGPARPSPFAAAAAGAPARTLQDAVQPLIEHYFTRHFAGAWERELRGDHVAERIESVVEALHDRVAEKVGAQQFTESGSAAAESERLQFVVPFGRSVRAVVNAWVDQHFAALWQTQLQQATTSSHIAGVVETCLSMSDDTVGRELYPVGQTAMALRAATERAAEQAVGGKFAGWFAEELRKDTTQSRLSDTFYTHLRSDTTTAHLEQRFDANLRSDASRVCLESLLQKTLRGDAATAYIDTCVERGLLRGGEAAAAAVVRGGDVAAAPANTHTETLAAVRTEVRRVMDEWCSEANNGGSSSPLADRILQVLTAPATGVRFAEMLLGWARALGGASPAGTPLRQDGEAARAGGMFADAVGALVAKHPRVGGAVGEAALAVLTGDAGVAALDEEASHTPSSSPPRSPTTAAVPRRLHGGGSAAARFAAAIARAVPTPPVADAIYGIVERRSPRAGAAAGDAAPTPRGSSGSRHASVASTAVSVTSRRDAADDNELSARVRQEVHRALAGGGETRRDIERLVEETLLMNDAVLDAVADRIHALTRDSATVPAPRVTADALRDALAEPAVLSTLFPIASRDVEGSRFAKAVAAALRTPAVRAAVVSIAGRRASVGGASVSGVSAAGSAEVAAAAAAVTLEDVDDAIAQWAATRLEAATRDYVVDHTQKTMQRYQTEQQQRDSSALSAARTDVDRHAVLDVIDEWAVENDVYEVVRQAHENQRSTPRSTHTPTASTITSVSDGTLMRVVRRWAADELPGILRDSIETLTPTTSGENRSAGSVGRREVLDLIRAWAADDLPAVVAAQVEADVTERLQQQQQQQQQQEIAAQTTPPPTPRAIEAIAHRAIHAWAASDDLDDAIYDRVQRAVAKGNAPAAPARGVDRDVVVDIIADWAHDELPGFVAVAVENALDADVSGRRVASASRGPVAEAAVEVNAGGNAAAIARAVDVALAACDGPAATLLHTLCDERIRQWSRTHLREVVRAQYAECHDEGAGGRRAEAATAVAGWADTELPGIVEVCVERVQRKGVVQQPQFPRPLRPRDMEEPVAATAAAPASDAVQTAVAGGADRCLAAEVARELRDANSAAARALRAAVEEGLWSDAGRAAIAAVLLQEGLPSRMSPAPASAPAALEVQHPTGDAAVAAAAVDTTTRLRAEVAAAEDAIAELLKAGTRAAELVVNASSARDSAILAALTESCTQQLMAGLEGTTARDVLAPYTQATSGAGTQRTQLQRLAAAAAAAHLERMQGELVDAATLEAKEAARAMGAEYAERAANEAIAAADGALRERMARAAKAAAREVVDTSYRHPAPGVQSTIDAQVRSILAKQLKSRAHGVATAAARGVVAESKPAMVAALDSRVAAILDEADADVREAVGRLTTKTVHQLAEEDLLPIVTERATAAREKVVQIEAQGVLKAAWRDVDAKIQASLQSLLDKRVLLERLQRAARDGFSELRERFAKDLKAKVNALVSREVGSEWLVEQVADVKENMRTRLLAGENEALDVAVDDHVRRHAARLVDEEARGFKEMCRAGLSDAIHTKAVAAARTAVNDLYETMLPGVVEDSVAGAGITETLTVAVDNAMRECARGAAADASAGDGGSRFLTQLAPHGPGGVATSVIDRRAVETLNDVVRRVAEREARAVASAVAVEASRAAAATPAAVPMAAIHAGVEEWVNNNSHVIAGRVLPVVMTSVESLATTANSPGPQQPPAGSVREAVCEALASDRIVRDELARVTQDCLVSEHGLWHPDVRQVLHAIVGSMDISDAVQRAVDTGAVALIAPPRTRALGERRDDGGGDGDGDGSLITAARLRETFTDILPDYIEPMRCELETMISNMVCGKADEKWVRDVLESKLDSSAALYELIRLENAKTNRLEAHELLNQKANLSDVVEHLNERPLRSEVRQWLQELRDDIVGPSRRRALLRSASVGTPASAASPQ